MFLTGRPSDARIREVIESQRDAEFSYAQVGATRGALPAGYNVDRHRVELGRGNTAFERAKQAVRSWTMFELRWVELCWPDAPVEPGSAVGVLVRFCGVWSLHVCRVVYVLDEPRRYGFAYGTLPEHAETGEELFTVEWREDDSVWYEILAFSRPKHVAAKLGYPAARRLQERFRRDSSCRLFLRVGRIPVKMKCALGRARVIC